MSKLIKDLERFSEMWLSNPGAQLDFARLIRRVVDTGGDSMSYLAIKRWVMEEEATAKRLGIRA